MQVEKQDAMQSVQQQQIPRATGSPEISAASHCSAVAAGVTATAPSTSSLLLPVSGTENLELNHHEKNTKTVYR